MNKNNVNLLVYSPTPESGIKIPVSIYIIFIRCILFYLARKIKDMCMRKNKFIIIYLFTGARVGNKKNIDVIYFIAT